VVVYYIMDPATQGDAKATPLTPQENLRLTKQFRRRLRTFVIVLFSLLIIVSLAYFMAVLVFWQIWPKIDGLTNMYSGFYGVAAAMALNIIAAWAGLATLYGKDAERVESQHSVAVCMLLAAGILFNIIFPTSALTPFDIDSRKRILTIPLHDCVDLKKDLDNIPVPECDYYDEVTLFLWLTLPLILLELIVLATYGYLKSSQPDPSDYDESILSVSITQEEDDAEDRVDALDTFTTLGSGAAAVIPQDEDASRYGGVNRRSSYGGDQYYWAQPQESYNGPYVAKSQSTPFGRTSRQNQYQ